MAKAEKTKLPKDLGGFKLTKAIRKAQPVEELMSTPEGRALLSETVAAGLGAALAVLRREAASPAPDGSSEPHEARIAAGAAIAAGIEGVLSAWTAQFGEIPAAQAKPAGPSRRRAPSSKPAVRRPRAARTEAGTLPLDAPAD